MKKLLALLLVLAMALSMAACAPAPAAEAEQPETETTKGVEGTTEAPTQAENTNPDVEVVTYYCTIGAYLHVLIEEIDKWNATTGAEKGVYIELTSNINDGNTAIEQQFTAGNYWDLMDGGSNATWVARGWVKDLEEVAANNADVAALLDSYRQYMVPGLSLVSGITTALPLEVVPIKMAVNLDLFEKSGLELPKTWDDVVAAAKKITEDTPGTAWGYGGTNWSVFYRRLHMKAPMNSTEVGWWDPNTETYSFAQYEPVIKAVAQMYADGSILGLDDLAIDPIRAEFAAGKVGMFIAPAYDWSVYTNQFPAQCNFAFIDVPTFVEGDAPYKGVYLDRINMSICAPLYDSATDAHKKAVEEAWLFLNSDELNSIIYANGGIIPYKPEIIANTELLITENAEQWAQMSDITNYTSMFVRPDTVLPLEGDTFEIIFSAIVHGELEWTPELIADLEQRYNDAYAAAKEDPDVDCSNYAYAYDHSK